MSDVLPELPRPPRPSTWGDRVVAFAESLDLSPTRLAVGGAAAVLVAVVGWRLLDAPPPPPEMQLPFVTTTVAEARPGQDGRSASSASSASSTSAEAGPGSPGGSTEGSPEGSVEEVVVHVAGAVAAPGVQRLPPAARVVDAIDAAGGAAPEADLARVNLAARLEDGRQVYVPKVGEPGGGGAPAAGPALPGVPGGDAASAPPVDLNAATVDELDALPGIGPAIAQAIVDHRATHGPFASVEDLLDVRGIGQAKLEELRSRVTV